MRLVVFLLLVASFALAAQSEDSPYYQRYQAYPEYCSDPSVMETRGIPPLPDTDTSYKSKIESVKVVIRHGARTPIHYKPCWKGHWDEPDGIWDCQLTTLLSTRPSQEGQFLVEKIYDAFLGEKDPSPYRNIMNGTCQDGQLIQQGYDQQIRNGQHLRQAYVFDGTDQNDDHRLRLMSNSDILQTIVQDQFLEGLLRYRSDDDQRTLASGQVLLSSMFGDEAEAYSARYKGKIPVITHHTADKERDFLAYYKQVKHCPRQQQVQKRGVESEAYKAFYHSDESKTMRQLIDDHLEPEGVLFGGIDCMMTSICTDRSLPEVISDYGLETSSNNDAYAAKYGTNRFQRLLDYVVQNKTFMSRYDDGELSKMDMGPLWAEIMESQEPFALFSGHDSTVFPLMASLGEKVWNATDFPAYATMMIIEFHEVIDKITGKAPSEFPSGKAFRLVYNGNVLTWLMDGCPQNSHLCDMSVFHNRVSRFATRKNHGCGVEEDADDIANSSKGSIGFLVGSMLSSFVVCSIVTFLVMQFCRRRPRTQHRYESQPVSTSGRDESFMDEPDIIVN